MREFNPNRARYRATFAAGGTNEPRLGVIDREAEVLHDVQITLEGEALGHDVWLDRKFCQDVADAGNRAGDAGVKVRFGHPSMCSDALGTYLGRAKSFRVVDLTRKDGTAAAGVLADIHLAPEAHHAPSGDLAAWVMETASNSPDTFGQSIVFTYGDYKVKDKDGCEHSYKAECVDAQDPERLTRKEWMDQSADGRVYVVLGKLHGTDFTDTPAATDGVFSATDLAAEAEAMLEQHPQILDIVQSKPETVYQFLTRIGVLEQIESKRVQNLQSEKDREIAALQKKLDDLQECYRRVQVEALEAQSTLNEEFSVQLKSKDEALDAAKVEIEQLNHKLEETSVALVASDEQLKKREHTLSMLGHNVNKCPVERQYVSAREELAKLPYDQRAAFYREHSNEIDHK